MSNTDKGISTSYCCSSPDVDDVLSNKAFREYAESESFVRPMLGLKFEFSVSTPSTMRLTYVTLVKWAYVVCVSM